MATVFTALSDPFPAPLMGFNMHEIHVGPDRAFLDQAAIVPLEQGQRVEQHLTRIPAGQQVPFGHIDRTVAFCHLVAVPYMFAT